MPMFNGFGAMPVSGIVDCECADNVSAPSACTCAPNPIDTTQVFTKPLLRKYPAPVLTYDPPIVIVPPAPAPTPAQTTGSILPLLIGGAVLLLLLQK